MSLKTCTICHVKKPTSEFHWTNVGRKTKCAQCKSCRASASKHYRQKYKKKRAVYDKKYYIQNREKYREWSHRRRKQLESCKEHFTHEQLSEQLNFQLGLCWYCARDISFDYTVDHFFPVSLLSDNSIGNIVLSCKTCNCSKNGKYPMEFDFLTNI